MRQIISDNNMPLSHILVFILVMACLSAPPLHSNAWAVDHSKIARTSVEQYIRPAYKQFAQTTSRLKVDVKMLCDKPSKSTLDKVQGAFRKTVLAWAKVDHIRFGPAGMGHRYERIMYWPDRKGRGLRQIRRVLSSQDSSVLSLESLEKKSVGLQGLIALEYLLYAKGHDALLVSSGEKSTFLCGYADAVSQNLANMAGEIDEAWQNGKSAETLFIELPEGTADDTQLAALTRELFQSFSSGLELIKDAKLNAVLGENMEKARPRAAIFWRSGLSLDFIAANIESLKLYYLRSGFSDLVRGTNPEFERQILANLNSATQILQSVKWPITLAVKDSEARDKLVYVSIAVEDFREKAGAGIVEATDLTLGFNATDGD